MTRAYGEPHVLTDGSTVIPVARVGRGGRVTPVGVFVIHEGKASWEAAVDRERIALLGAITGLVAATLSTLAILRRPPWPDLSVPGLRVLNQAKPDPHV
ncbi:hypothetical protein EV193_102263 [Herbihabitans rhizosphaerae]|uniref:Uncharacterized protein n=1 Tax=Herbihabitans rhizosphaerae TaxID=1872711 RepID=A0A4Q7L2C5_9PSEU|nr:hypothetical protein [Herbihabitans rhizosphaerae]RZS43284.1 hypothetical protein EV193_102263 [Herbihabitans rhizosphaerae]